MLLVMAGGGGGGGGGAGGAEPPDLPAIASSPFEEALLPCATARSSRREVAASRLSLTVNKQFSYSNNNSDSTV